MKLKYTKFQIVIELMALLLLLSIFIYLILAWGSLPDQIPGHYNGAGIVDRWGNKKEIWILPIMGLILYILITVISRFPAIWNVPVKITDENREYVYSNLKSMLIIVKMDMVIIFAYLVYSDINTQFLGVWFLPLVLILLFGNIIYYIIKVSRRRT